MKKSMRTRRRLLAKALAGGLVLGAGLGLGTTGAFAQQKWPTAPIKLIVPYAPGGVNDIVMRLLGRHVGDKLGQPIIIDNRPGAGGIVGTSAVAKAPADGYTIGAAATSTLIATPLTNPQSSIDVGKELAFVSLVATVPMMLTVNASMPVKTATELTSYVHDHPGKLSYGSMAVGHYGHVTLMELSDAQKAGMVHSAYKGESPLLQDLVGDQIQLALVTPPAVKAMADSGRVRLLGVSGTKRLKLFPDVPTLAEQGYKSPIYQMNAGWMGIIAPAATPPAILQRLSTEFAAAVRSPEVSEQLTALGLDPVGSTAAEFQATYAKEKPVWRDLLVKAGLEVK